ncbi:transcriptional regulator, TraR/DksA family [Paracoccus solventivorans]|uniref:DksA/TraR family C4-type zinc finger protein n=1 Tax=Paracoccus solventivorans TaxID=53463 RepID=A0A1M7D647_9RHOB|nr:DksA/TraR family C4-type zinc finger protein [Paracoccus solventivorans]SHL74935.1 transcriptional regulator, TraR/DksA family [Paracoccus solventivorans]HHW32825.1 DksA/TraR family C4-type zinc finger protein [Paracoccus solventivorans]
MAGGWATDGAVNEQIEVSTEEALARMRLRNRRGGESLAECADCGDPIPEARRRAVPGVTLCVACQSEADRRFVPGAGINRRGSKDSQLR